MIKRISKYLVVFLLLVLSYVIYGNYQKLVLISGFSAKSVASGVFLANRTQNSIEQSDNNFTPITWAENDLDEDSKSVTTEAFGLKKRTAIYRGGLGAVLMNKDYNSEDTFLVPKREKKIVNLPFPYGDLGQKDTVFSEINYDRLSAVVKEYLENDNEQSTTRSLLVIYKDQIIAEEYAEGFDKNSLHLGWSMTKSLMSAIFGVMEYQEKLRREDFAPINSWKNDERSKITISNLLQMNSGLEWEEDYTKISDVTRMLFLDSDMTKTQIDKPLVSSTNASWNYSSGTSNLLSGILRQKFQTHQEYLDFWYTDLIDKIGMHSMTVETDLAGNYVSSAYAWATTRDWARFGLLYLKKGNWNGEQIFSENWVDYTVTPTNSSEGVYGAQFWLNAGGHLPDVPKDVFFADGYQGQRIFVIPSKELVIVRTGVSYSNINELLEQRPVKPDENIKVVEFELNNKVYNNLLKKIISSIN